MALRGLPLRIRNQLPELKDPLMQRPLDLNFIGTLNSRREKFFAANASWLSQYCNFFHIPSMDFPLRKGEGQALDTESVLGISRRSKILLNIHRDNLPYFEWHRIVFHGLWQNTLVVTEPCHDVPGLLAGEHFIECHLSDMEEMLYWLLSTSEGVQKAEQVRNAGHQALIKKFNGENIMANSVCLIENILQLNEEI